MAIRGAHLEFIQEMLGELLHDFYNKKFVDITFPDHWVLRRAQLCVEKVLLIKSAHPKMFCCKNNCLTVKANLYLCR